MNKNLPKSVPLMCSFFFSINHEHCFHEKSIITFSHLPELITFGEKKFSDSTSGRSLLPLKNDTEGGVYSKFPKSAGSILHVNTTQTRTKTVKTEPFSLSHQRKTNKKSKSVLERLPKVKNFHYYTVYKMRLEKVWTWLFSLVLVFLITFVVKIKTWFNFSHFFPPRWHLCRPIPKTGTFAGVKESAVTCNRHTVFNAPVSEKRKTLSRLINAKRSLCDPVKRWNLQTLCTTVDIDPKNCDPKTVTQKNCDPKNCDPKINRGR